MASAENFDVLDASLQQSFGLPGLRLGSNVSKQSRMAAGVMCPKGSATPCDEEPAPEPSPQRVLQVRRSIHAIIPSVATILLASSAAPFAFSAAKETIYLS